MTVDEGDDGGGDDRGGDDGGGGNDVRSVTDSRCTSTKM